MRDKQYMKCNLVAEEYIQELEDLVQYSYYEGLHDARKITHEKRKQLWRSSETWEQLEGTK